MLKKIPFLANFKIEFNTFDRPFSKFTRKISFMNRPLLYFLQNLILQIGQKAKEYKKFSFRENSFP